MRDVYHVDVVMQQERKKVALIPDSRVISQALAGTESGTEWNSHGRTLNRMGVRLRTIRGGASLLCCICSDVVARSSISLPSEAIPALQAANQTHEFCRGNRGE
jgi:hypothetical protein